MIPPTVTRPGDVLNRLKSAEKEIRAYGVQGLFLFGSQARGDATDSSDVEVFVDPAHDGFYDLANFVGPYLLIERLFPGSSIGFTTRLGAVARRARAGGKRSHSRLLIAATKNPLVRLGHVRNDAVDKLIQDADADRPP